MNRILVLIFLIISQINLFSQTGEIDLSREKNLFIQDELSGGFKLSTNGWGMDFRDGYFVTLKQKRLYEIGFNIIHSPKEYKLSSQYYLTKSFVYGKLNECADLKAGLGRQFLLYDKKEPGSVAIRLFFFTGLDLAILKPIYYTVIINSYSQTQEMMYESSLQPALIVKKAAFTKGFNEIKIDPGIYFKIGTSFEHSKEVNLIQNLELGIESYIFLNKLEIMGDVENPRFITSLFLSYRMGSLIKNRQRKKEKSNI